MEKRKYVWIRSLNKDDILQWKWIYGHLEYQWDNSELFILWSLSDDFLKSLKEFTENNSCSYVWPIYWLVDSTLKITLYRSIMIWSTVSSWLCNEKYNVRKVFFDGYIDNFDLPQDSIIKVEIPHLNKRFWDTIWFTCVEKNVEAKSKKLEIPLESKKIDLWSYSDFDLSFNNRTWFKTQSSNYSTDLNDSWYYRDFEEVKCYASFNLEFNFKNHLSFDDRIWILNKTLRFFSFFMSHEVWYSVLHIPQLRDKSIKLEWNTKKVDNQHYLLLFKDIENDFHSILEKWLKNYERMNHIIETYFSLCYDENMYIEVVFLNYIQAIEWIYLEFYDAPYTKEEYEQKKKQYDLFIQEKKSELDFVELLHFKFNDVPLANKLKVIGEEINYERKIDWIDIKNDLVDLRNVLSHWYWWEKRAKFLEDLNKVHKMNFLMSYAMDILIINRLWLWDELFSVLREKIMTKCNNSINSL